MAEQILYIPKTSFSQGQLSEKLKARYELDQYNQGAKRISNMIVLKHGGVTRRHGTRFVDEVYDSTSEARLIPFVFSKTLAYLIVLNGDKIEFIKDGAYITSGPSRVQLTNPYSEVELFEVTYAQIGPSMYLCHPDHPPKVITRSSDTSWQIEDVVFEYYALSDQWYESAYVRFKILEGSTKAVVGDAFTINSASGVVGFEPALEDETAYTGGTQGTFAAGSTYAVNNLITLSNGAVVRVDAVSTGAVTQFTVVAAGETIAASTTLTQASTTGSGTGFTLTPKAPNLFGRTGNFVVFGDSVNVATVFEDTTEAWLVECVYADQDETQWTVTGTTSGTMYAQWRTNDYPAAIGLFDQRLYFAGSPSYPQRIWFSAIGDYQNITRGTAADDGGEATIASGEFNQILHLVDTRRLLAFTFGSEFSIEGSESSGITPGSIYIQKQTAEGTSIIKPVQVGPDVLFVPRDRKRMNSVSYSLSEDVFRAPEITILAEDIAGDLGFKEISFAQSPDYVTWVTRNDGKLASLTLIRDFGVNGWALHETVNDGTHADDGKFEAIATIPNVTIDQTYVVVQRWIDGGYVRYVEYIDYVTNANTDCSLIATSETGTDSWGGFDHLEGRQVAVIADGSYIGLQFVSSGIVATPTEVNEVEVGLNYYSRLTDLHPNTTLRDGTSQGRVTRVSETILDLYQTRGGIYVGLEDQDGEMINESEIPFNTDGDVLGEPPVLYTGKKKSTIRGWSPDLNVAVEQRHPQSFTLLGFTHATVINESN